MMRVLITGGAGFIGSNFVRFMLQNHPKCEIVVLDKLTYAGRLENLKDVRDRIEFIRGDICERNDVNKAIKNCDVVFNFAAETHVDKSIIEAGIFVKTDVFGTHTLLEASRKNDVNKFIQISTDEVYGSAESGSFKESDVLNPSSPYSASKAGADMLVNAYFKTYGLPVIITRSTNNYGPFQFPEKLIPVLITNALEGKQLPIYGNGKNVRDWIYVFDNCEAVDMISEKGNLGEIYNVAANNERSNIDVAKLVLKELGKSENMIEFVEDRPGHDRRYSLNAGKVRKLGWKPKTSFEVGIKKTVDWYSKNKRWWQPLKVR